MYHIKQIDSNKIRVYLHESSEKDIHQVCFELMYSTYDNDGGEYIADSDTTATISFFYNK